MTTHPRKTSPRRRGITLLEMLLVLGLLVAIAALTMPTVTQPLENHRLRKSADQIRAEWTKARALAMETGRTYVFRYVPESDGYQVEPWYSDEDYLESSELTGLGTTSPLATPPGELLSNQVSSAAMKHLPEEIFFVASDTTQEARELLAVQGFDALQNQDTTMSAPIFFYPDGTSSTARLIVMNARGRYVKLTLRGLTGVVYVSDLLSGEQIQ